MLQALSLSLGQLFDRPVLAVFAKSFLLTLLLFAAGGVGLWYALHGLEAAVSGWTGSAGSGWLADVATVLVLVLAWWLLFRAIAIAAVGVFADDVVAAVEARHYPTSHAAAHDVPLARSAAMGLGSAARAVGVNLLMSPLYLVLLITGVGTAAAFFLVNAWLLGRDLGDMVAVRHMPFAEVADWRTRTRGRRFVLGAVVTALLLIPFVNLAAPVLGAAMATHLFHRGRRA
ncbi:EI24 domain-containing protein [Sphingomonas xinjiangensis]|uniref:Uncharacterized protein involved in cysteine biosynthesis n=1 Tax=Sphingomonas xinjiangensis TaxID=643568 RepID=A0A840YBX3_9SPHN|nr:EI24 domain-containing protein [Sphingomonas xinjiangensis]MBB5709795.1 uncharacterized protein involved in cysteine biosynthesis [Sphingomonas xinjiangensis]